MSARRFLSGDDEPTDRGRRIGRRASDGDPRRIGIAVELHRMRCRLIHPFVRKNPDPRRTTVRRRFSIFPNGLFRWLYTKVLEPWGNIFESFNAFSSERDSRPSRTARSLGTFESFSSVES